MTSLSISGVRNFLGQPYPFYANTRQAWQLVVVISFFIGAFCMIFQPYTLSELPVNIKNLVALGFGGVTFLACTLNMVFMPRVFPGLLAESHWTVWKEALWVFWMVFTIATLNYVYAQIFFGFTHEWEVFVAVQKFTFIIAVMPAIGVIFYKQVYHYKQNLKEVEHLNKILRDRASGELPDVVMLSSSNGQDKIRIDHRDICFIASAGNYVEVFYQESGAEKKILLRNKISTLAEQLAGYPILQRCHRTYMVNIKMVSYLEGNSQGYKLHLLNRKEIIPVSRSFSGNIKKMIETLFDR